MKKIPAYNLQDVLVALVIIGIITLIAVPMAMPYITKAKSTEAQIQLKYIFNLQTTHRYMYSKYSNDLDEIDFIAPKTINQEGTAYYIYEILNSSNTSFTARATAIVDFDGDGIFNVWEINEKGAPKITVKD